MKFTNWIDRRFDEIKETQEFKEFFSAIELTIIDCDNYLFNPEKGIDVVMTVGLVIKSIHLFSGNTSESKEFKGEIINKLTFQMDRLDVERILGKPNRKGGGYKDILGDVPSWDKYYFDFYSLHIQYSLLTGRIDLITIGSLDLEPYLNSALQ